ncbi:unnamed protein product, partial [Prorocentrum cordatum]
PALNSIQAQSVNQKVLPPDSKDLRSVIAAADRVISEFDAITDNRNDSASAVRVDAEPTLKFATDSVDLVPINIQDRHGDLLHFVSDGALDMIEMLDQAERKSLEKSRIEDALEGRFVPYFQCPDRAEPRMRLNGFVLHLQPPRSRTADALHVAGLPPDLKNLHSIIAAASSAISEFDAVTAQRRGSASTEPVIAEPALTLATDPVDLMPISTPTLCDNMIFDCLSYFLQDG